MDEKVYLCKTKNKELFINTLYLIHRSYVLGWILLPIFIIMNY